MFLTKTILVLLFQANLFLIAKGQMTGGDEEKGDCLEIVDVALVVDVSGSIEGDGAHPGYFNEFVKPFMKRFAEDLNVAPGKAQLGLVTFGNEGILEFHLMSDLNEILRRIDLFDYNNRGKNTNTSGGINVMRTQLLSIGAPNYRPKAVHVAVVITDGVSTIDHDQTIPSAKKAQEEGIIMLAVGVTQAINVTELTAIASQLSTFNVSSLKSGMKNGVFTPSSTVAYVPDIKDLVTVVTQLVTHLKNAVCNSTGNCPRGDKAEWCSRVQPSDCVYAETANTCCKTCANPGGPVNVCDDYADIAFVVDVSGSIGKDRNDPGYFDREVKPFLRSFVRRLNVGPGKIQVGIVTFGNRGYLQFTLTPDINEVISGIDKIVYPQYGENTNTSGGIYIMRTQILGPYSPNYRSNASHLAFVVTDGQSTWDREKTVPSARDAKNQGIVIFSIGATNNINLQELVDIASDLPGFNFSQMQNTIRHNMSGISGSVAYSPTIEDLSEIVLQVTNYLSNTDCKKATERNIVRSSCVNNAYWCSSIFLGSCYNPQTERTCCKFCRENLRSNPICRYGNEFSWCAPQHCWDTTRNCCETCPITECKNNAYWCTSIFPGQCYNRQTEQTCCRFCRERLTGDPMCRYGDEFDWCAPQHCWDTTRNCCRTCPRY